LDLEVVVAVAVDDLPLVVLAAVHVRRADRNRLDRTAFDDRVTGSRRDHSRIRGLGIALVQGRLRLGLSGEEVVQVAHAGS
jgi:hypothetical protein